MIAAGVREVKDGVGYRVYQLHKPKNSHLVDVRAIDELPPGQCVEGVLVLTPPELIANKILLLDSRRGQPKSFTDQRDLAVQLLTLPELKIDEGPVTECLRAGNAPESALAAWRDVVAEEILPEDEDSGY